MLPRRTWLQLTLGGLLSRGIWPGRARAAENGKGSGEWTFLSVNDLHYSSAECGPWFEKVVAAMKTSAPSAEFCLLVGDQADEGKPEQLTAIRDVFKNLGMPIYATVGNHDHSPDDDRTAYDAAFPGQLNQWFEHRRWQIIGIDSSDGARYHDTAIQESTFAWLRDTLPKLDPAAPTILFTHFPLGAEVKYRPSNAEGLLELFLKFNLQAVLNGHWHGYTENQWRDSLITTDRCCSRVRNNHDGTKEKGWFVCTAKDGHVTRRFVQIPEELRAAV